MRKLFLTVFLVLLAACVYADFPGSPIGGGGSGTTSASDLTSGTLPAARIADNSVTNAKLQYDDLGNVGFGDNVFSSLTTGYSNVAIGFDTQDFNETGRENISLGHSALRSSTNAWRNIALGARSLYSLTTGRNNYAFGDDSQYYNVTGRYNISIGPETLRDNISSYYNIALGFETLPYTTAEKNIGIGRQALFADNTGTLNVAVGDAALSNNTTGSYNTALGAATGNSLVGGSSQETGSYNTWVGYNAHPSTSNQTNATGLGNGAITTADNQVSFGDNNVTSFLFGGSPITRSGNVLTIPSLASDNVLITGGTITVDTVTAGEFVSSATDNTRGVTAMNTARPTGADLAAGKCWVLKGATSATDTFECNNSDNTAVNIFGAVVKTFSFTIDNVVVATDNILLMKVPRAMTLTQADCYASTDNVVGSLMECASDNVTSCTVLDSWTVTNAVSPFTDSTMTDGAVASGAWIRWSTTSVGTTNSNKLSCTVRYRE